jgi:hypothetical protein
MGKTADRTFRSPDDTTWRIEVRSPGSSNAMVVFHHPRGIGSRYAWHLATGPESRSVTGRLVPARVLEGLDDRTLAQLFRRSMPIDATRQTYNREIDRAS